MGRDEVQKQRYEELFNKLRKSDSLALASELSALIVYGLGGLIDEPELLKRLEEKSAIARKMKKGKTVANKQARLMELQKKMQAGKRLTQAERQEALKLCKDLGIKLG